MENSLLHKQINELLDRIKTQQTILQQANTYSEIERDLTLDHIKNLYSLVKQIENPLQTSTISPSASSTKENKHKQELPFSESQTERIPIKDSSEFSQERQIESVINIESMQDEPVIVSNGLEIPLAGERSFDIGGASMSEDIPSLHDRLTQSSSDSSLADKMQTQPLSDIKSAIGMNEKFFYIKELFGGNGEEYLSTLELLNTYGSYDEAFGYLRTNAFEKYGWETSNPAVEQFLGLLERRFASKA